MTTEELKRQLKEKEDEYAATLAKLEAHTQQRLNTVGPINNPAWIEQHETQEKAFRATLDRLRNDKDMLSAKIEANEMRAKYEEQVAIGRAQVNLGKVALVVACAAFVLAAWQQWGPHEQTERRPTTAAIGASGAATDGGE